MTSKELIKGCKKNRKEAQKALYGLYAPKLMGLCRRYSKNREEAEDIFQEGFVKAFGSIGKLQSSSMLETWLKRIFVNTAINYYHKQKRHYHHFDSDELEIENNDYEDIVGKMTQQELLVFINDLPDGYRMVFNLYVLEGYNHREIAEMLDISEGTSKSQLSKAKKMLKERLRKAGINKELFM